MKLTVFQIKSISSAYVRVTAMERVAADLQWIRSIKKKQTHDWKPSRLTDKMSSLLMCGVFFIYSSDIC